MDLSTQYLGLTLKNPLVPSASPLSQELDTARRLEDAGASAIVMYSLFEEEIRFDLANNLCRCTGYDKIVRSVQEAQRILNEEAQATTVGN